MVDVDSVLRLFAEDKIAARKLYRQFMGDMTVAIKKKDIYATVDQRIRGDEEFVERQRGKARQLTMAKRMISLVTSEYGYRNREVAEHMGKDPDGSDETFKEEGTSHRRGRTGN